MDKTVILTIVGLIGAFLFERNRRQKAEAKDGTRETEVKSAKIEAKIEEKAQELSKNASKIKDVEQSGPAGAIGYWISKAKGNKK